MSSGKHFVRQKVVRNDPEHSKGQEDEGEGPDEDQDLDLRNGGSTGQL